MAIQLRQRLAQTCFSRVSHYLVKPFDCALEHLLGQCNFALHLRIVVILDIACLQHLGRDFCRYNSEEISVEAPSALDRLAIAHECDDDSGDFPSG